MELDGAAGDGVPGEAAERDADLLHPLRRELLLLLPPAGVVINVTMQPSAKGVSGISSIMILPQVVGLYILNHFQLLDTPKVTNLVTNVLCILSAVLSFISTWDLWQGLDFACDGCKAGLSIVMMHFWMMLAVGSILTSRFWNYTRVAAIYLAIMAAYIVYYVPSGRWLPVVAYATLDSIPLMIFPLAIFLRAYFYRRGLTSRPARGTGVRPDAIGAALVASASEASDSETLVFSDTETTRSWEPEQSESLPLTGAFDQLRKLASERCCGRSSARQDLLGLCELSRLPIQFPAAAVLLIADFLSERQGVAKGHIFGFESDASSSGDSVAAAWRRIRGVASNFL